MRRLLLSLLPVCLCLVTGGDEACLVGVPECLSFVEPLMEPLRPFDIVLFTGGDSAERRSQGYAKLAARMLERFAQHHGYRLVFLDQLEYDKDLSYGGVSYSGHWQRVFAMPALRSAFPDARYFVWFDDDILVAHWETDMLNHYINFLELLPDCHLLFAADGGPYVLNSGMFFMRNSDLAFRVYAETIPVGAERGGFLARHFGHEQEAIVEVRGRLGLEGQVRTVGHRHGKYNWNTFSRSRFLYTEELKARQGDAFVHFTGISAEARERGMLGMVLGALRWRDSVPATCRYPIDTAI